MISDSARAAAAASPATAARSWSLLLMLLAFLVRLWLIFPGPLESKVHALSNWADLRNYYWPAQAVLQGANPYVLWQNGQSGEFRADMAPLELAVYVATVSLWNDPRAIQLLFALVDVLNVLLLGVLLCHSQARVPFQILYALSPVTLYNLVLVPEDKTIVLALCLLLLYLLLRFKDATLPLGKWRADPAIAIMVLSGLIAAFKWLAVFYALPLLFFVSPDLRLFIRNGFLMATVIVLAHIPWFPSWWYVYAFRSARTSTPLHISPAVLLEAAGLFNQILLLLLLIGSLAIIYWLFWTRRIDIFETIALSVAGGVFWTPDMDPVHLILVVLFLLLIVDWTQPIRLALVWLVGALVAAVYSASTLGGLERFGLGWLRVITGEYGSPQMILLSYALFVMVFAFYIVDKRAGRPVGISLLRSVGNASVERMNQGLDAVRASS